ncbi:MAG: tetratricopeptide repeat protein, partial [Anaerolineae bacterium]|nr:tetratricopeptide repeat protein [Anaerolineae bacterium]
MLSKRGNVFRERRDFDKALETYRRAFELAPNQ